MSFAAVFLATRCGFPATAPLAEKVDCKDDQDGQDDYQDGHDVQDDHQDDRDHDVQDDYHEDQDVLDSAFVSSVRSSNTHPDLLLIHHHPLFQI